MEQEAKYRTDFLFSGASFWSGVGTVLNISGNYFAFSYSSSDSEADRRALENDWGVIWQDVYNALDAGVPKLAEYVEEEAQW